MWKHIIDLSCEVYCILHIHVFVLLYENKIHILLGLELHMHLLYMGENAEHSLYSSWKRWCVNPIFYQIDLAEEMI